MKKKAAPVVGLTWEEIQENEENAFLLRVGDDFLHDDAGNFFFDAMTAEEYKKGTIKGLKSMLANGTKAEKQEAISLLPTVEILPMRYH